MQRFDVLLYVGSLSAFVVAILTEHISVSSTIWAIVPLFFLVIPRWFISNLFLWVLHIKETREKDK